MRYQVFLRVGNKACSKRVEAESKREAKKKALKQAKREYGLDFRVWEVFDEGGDNV